MLADMRAEGTRQHEETIASVRGTIEEQATVLVTTVRHSWVARHDLLIQSTVP